MISLNDIPDVKVAERLTLCFSVLTAPSIVRHLVSGIPYLHTSVNLPLLITTPPPHTLSALALSHHQFLARLKTHLF